MRCYTRIASMCLYDCAWILVCLWTSVNGYNLDISFPIIFSGSKGDYFGYTVALHRNREGSLALVGAPRANSSFLPVHQPGVLFKCNIQTSSTRHRCTEITLDERGNTQTLLGNERSYRDMKDGMWLGVSLDVQQNRAHNDIVACGHLWKNQYYVSHYLANGVCYVINSDLDPKSVVKLVPLVQRSKQAIPDPGIYYFAFGQAGMSASFSEDGNNLLLGAPGIYDWLGSIVSYSSDPNSRDMLYSSPLTPDPPAGLSAEAYLGYSVTSGKFFNNDTFYAVGAPRDNDNHGRVYIFKPLEQKKNELFVHQKKEGSQLGEYFGASVLGVNLNGDKFTDLLVGAPFYSLETGGDEGKVYVYISNGVGLQPYAELMGSSKSNSRFGTAIANVGDLNQDGYNDIAIGAPYEDGKGSIYIFHGSEAGMRVQYVQKIAAADISPQLSGFGIHISRGLDIDNNRYPDILVGSYESSNAVLFRTRPISQLFPKLEFSPNQINMNVTPCEFGGKNLPCVNVTACLWFMGKHLSLPLDFITEMFVEHPSQTNLISPRGFFVQDGRQVTEIRENATLNIGSQKCSTHVLYIHPKLKDMITPIQILFRYRLAEPPNANKTFHKSFPVIAESSPTNITSAITFQTGCGSEDKCLSDLEVTAVLLGNEGGGHQLIRGITTSISIAITVRNVGEPAYLAELLIYLPPDMPIIQQGNCANTGQGNNASLVCDLGNPLFENKKIDIKLDVTKIPTDRKFLDIYLEARTVSTELTPENNEMRIPLTLEAMADISISGVPAQEQILYDEDEVNITSVPIVHTYTVRNYGPSPLETIDIVLYVPKLFQDHDGKIQFLTLRGLESDTGRPLTIPAKCNDTYLDLKNINLGMKQHRGQAFGEDDLVAQDNDNGTNRYYNHSSDMDRAPPLQLRMNPDDDDDDDNDEDDAGLIIHRSKKSAEKSKAGAAKKRETIVINCQNENVECIAIHCTASPFTDTRKIAQITLTAEMNISILNDFLGAWYRVEFVTSGHISTKDSYVKLQNNLPDDFEVKTILVHKGPPPSEELALWIILVSIGAGILLLIIILILLIRFGFFRRGDREHMEKMLEAENKDFETMPEPNEKDSLNK